MTNAAVLIVFFIVWAFSLFIFLYYHQSYQRLRARSRAMVIVQSIGVLVQPCCLPLSLAIGISPYPCDLYFYLCFWILPMVIGSQALVVAMYRIRRRVAKHIANYDIIKPLAGHSLNQGSLTPIETETSSDAMQSYTNSWDSFLLSSKGFMMMHILLQVSFLLLGRIVAEFIPYIGHGCYGCINSLGELLIISSSVVLVSAVTLPFGYLERNTPDPFGILREASIQLYLPGSFGTLGLILLITDPGDKFKNNQFNWGWIVMLGPLTLHLISTSFQVYLAWRERKVGHEYQNELVQQYSVSHEAVVDGILKDAELSEKFEKHIETEFSSENLRCYMACKAWRDTYDLRGSAYRDKLAKQIYSSYIPYNATVMQVNISADLRERLAKTISTMKYSSKSLFDDLIAELATLVCSILFVFALLMIQGHSMIIMYVLLVVNLYSDII